MVLGVAALGAVIAFAVLAAETCGFS